MGAPNSRAGASLCQRSHTRAFPACGKDVLALPPPAALGISHSMQLLREELQTKKNKREGNAPILAALGHVWLMKGTGPVCSELRGDTTLTPNTPKLEVCSKQAMMPNIPLTHPAQHNPEPQLGPDLPEAALGAPSQAPEQKKVVLVLFFKNRPQGVKDLLLQRRK